MTGPALLAHVAIAKFADHLPLYRQSVTYAREGVMLSRSTLADWLGQVSLLLRPLLERIAEHPVNRVEELPPWRVANAPGVASDRTIGIVVKTVLTGRLR